LHNELLNIII